MKFWIASFFLLIFSFQVLPVKEVGKLLFKNALTEEIHEKDELPDGDADLKLKKEGDSNDFISSHPSYQQRARYFSHCVDIALVNTDIPRLVFSPEVLTPPPNC